MHAQRLFCRGGGGGGDARKARGGVGWGEIKNMIVNRQSRRCTLFGTNKIEGPSSGLSASRRDTG